MLVTARYACIHNYIHACMLTGSYRFVLHCMQTRETRIPSEMCARKRVSLMGNTNP